MQVVERVEVEYIPDKAEMADYFFEDFKKIFEKFTFTDASVDSEVGMVISSSFSSYLSLHVTTFVTLLGRFRILLHNM